MKHIIANFFLVLFTPSCWLRQGYYDAEFEKWCLTKAADINNFSDFGCHTVKLSGKTIWVVNHPYASWTERTGHTNQDYRPSRAATIRLQRMMLKARYQQP